MQHAYNTKIQKAKSDLKETHSLMVGAAELARGGVKPDYDILREIKNIALEVAEVSEQIHKDTTDG